MSQDDRGLQEIRRGVGELCAGFPDAYWRDLDARREYPEEFVRAMTEAGYLAALIPEEYGGMGLDLAAACAILEEANRSGANANPAHAQMYVMGTLLRHGSDDQKEKYLPKTANARMRTVGDFLDHPQLEARGRWRELGSPAGPLRGLLPPATLEGTEPTMAPIPAVGEHTEGILRELGYDEAGISTLKHGGVT